MNNIDTSNITNNTDTTLNVIDIPFPALRTISGKHWNKNIIFSIDYFKLEEQMKCFNENKLHYDF